MSILFFGHRLFGKTLDVKGVFYVATKCFHLQFIPIFPSESYIMLPPCKQDDKSFPRDDNFEVTRVGLSLGWKSSAGRGIPIGRHWRSFGMAWLRLGMILAALFSCMCVLEASMESHPLVPMAVGVAMIIGSVSAWIGSYYAPKLGRANHHDAVALLDWALAKGRMTEVLHQILKLRVDAAYGVVTHAEAEKDIAAIEAVMQVAAAAAEEALRKSRAEDRAQSLQEREKEIIQAAAARAAVASDEGDDKWAKWRSS